ncbi:MAG: flagellar protein FlaG [Betaproteobacteria bacterium]|nr:flagellar protein FlaG [Betaproteobacteria bacterium]
MLTPNISNTTQAQQPTNLANTSLASNGESGVVVSVPGTAVEMPKIATQQASGPQPSSAQLQSAVNNINQMLKQDNKGVEFSVDSSTKKSIVKVVDSTAIDRIQNGLLLTQKA